MQCDVIRLFACAVLVVASGACGPRGQLTIVDPPLQGDATSTFVDFGAVFGPGTRSGRLSYLNSGEGPIRFISVRHESGADVALGLSEFSEQPFLFEWPGETTVQPGDRLDFALRFAAVHAEIGDNVATLTLTVENAQEPAATISLLGHEVSGACGSIDLDFGNVRVGSVKTMQLDVRNTLTVAATVSVSRTVRSDAFSFSPPLATSKDLESREILPLEVTFAPTEPGEIKETLNVTYDTLCLTTATVHGIAK